MEREIFLITFSGYILFLIALGWLVSRKQKTGEDFLLSGRNLSGFLTLGTTVATMVGTGTSMGAVGYAYSNGWAGTLYGLGGAVGILLLAWLFAPVRKLRFMTMSEELSYYVGANKIIKNCVGVLIFVASIGWLGAHIIGGGLYLAWVSDMDLSIAKILVAGGFAIYVIIGGYTAVVWTDTIQAIVLFGGFLLMAVLAVLASGGWENLIASQPSENISFFAIEKIRAIPALSLAVVVMVGLLATPSYRQRIYSAKNVSTVRKSFLAAGGLYLLFSFIPAIIGMSAYALNANLEQESFAFPYLALQVLPVGIGIIVLVAGLSATMSSASSDAIAAVAILLRDIMMLLTGKVPPKQKAIFYSRIGIALTVGTALMLALVSNNIIDYITGMIATVMSGLFCCSILGRFWSRFNWQGALACLIGGSVTSIVILNVDRWIFFWGNPILPSVGISAVLGVLVSLAMPKCHIDSDEANRILEREREQMEGL